MELVASQKKIQLVVTEGVFTNTATNTKVLNLPGSAYGFCVRLDAQERKLVFAEAAKKEPRGSTIFKNGFH